MYASPIWPLAGREVLRCRFTCTSLRFEAANWLLNMKVVGEFMWIGSGATEVGSDIYLAALACSGQSQGSKAMVEVNAAGMTSVVWG